MKKYETKIINGKNICGDMLDQLNSHGQDGWHVVAAYENSGAVILQRVIEEKQVKGE